MIRSTTNQVFYEVEGPDVLSGRRGRRRHRLAEECVQHPAVYAGQSVDGKQQTRVPLVDVF